MILVAKCSTFGSGHDKKNEKTEKMNEKKMKKREEKKKEESKLKIRKRQLGFNGSYPSQKPVKGDSSKKRKPQRVI